MEMKSEKEEVGRCWGSEKCNNCSELKSKCDDLESKIEKKRSAYDSLEAKFKDLEAEKIRIEDELKELKIKNGDNIRVVDLTEEGVYETEDPVIQVMIENKVLECEKRRAESEVEILKQKLKELESRVLKEEMNGDGNKVIREVKNGEGFGSIQQSGMPYIGTPPKDIILIEQNKDGINVESKMKHESRIRKQLSFKEDTSCSKKVAPSTPSGAKSTSVNLIDISDSDDDEKKLLDAKEMTSNGVQFISTPKRKRASNIVTSDDESDADDDNIPIRKLKKLHLQGTNSDQSGSGTNPNLVTRPRRLVSLRKCEDIKKQQEIPTTEDLEDGEESEESRSESEGESLNGFIVESSEDSVVGDGSVEVEDNTDDDVDFHEILSRFKRSRDEKFEWNFEADMLADFGKDLELCMKAVCALYRQQTSEEKISKGTLVYNHRGFNKIDAYRGTTLAEFLTDGDPQGDLRRTVEELQAHDSKGVEKCRTLATRYSKQLFEIYKNKEDPLFLPS